MRSQLWSLVDVSWQTLHFVLFGLLHNCSHEGDRWHASDTGISSVQLLCVAVSISFVIVAVGAPFLRLCPAAAILLATGRSHCRLAGGRAAPTASFHLVAALAMGALY
jgi:hypothetical protein